MSLTRPASEIARRVPMRHLLVATPLVVIAMGAAIIGARVRLPENVIAAGVHVGDLDLGGKTRDDAKPLLQHWASRRQAVQIVLRCPAESGVTRNWKPDVEKLGLTINVDSTLDIAAKAGRQNIAGQLTHLFSGPEVIRITPVPDVDVSHLRAYLKRQIAADVNRKPKNAAFVLLKGGGFGAHHDQNGLSLDVEASVASIKHAWAVYLDSSVVLDAQSASRTPGSTAVSPVATSDQTVSSVGAETTRSSAEEPTSGPQAELTLSSTTAALTYADIQQIDTLLGSKSSYVNGTTARLGNIRIAASHINGTLLRPGETFSYNRIVGPRDEDEGYREAPILIRGKHDHGIAGGICQTSGTLFNAVLKSGLKIVEREHHSTPIGYLPIGLDATVSYGSLDLKFSNDTDAPVYISATLNGRSLTFSLFGKSVPGREVALVRGGFSRTGASYETRTDRTKRPGYKHILEPGASGAQVTWYRIIRENGSVVRRDVISSHYSPHPGIVVIGAAPAKPHQPRHAMDAPGIAPNVSPGAGGPAPPVRPSSTLQP